MAAHKSTVDIALPEAKGKITCSGTELTIMADVDESGLAAHLRTVPAPFTPEVTRPACGCCLCCELTWSGAIEHPDGQHHYRDC